MPRAEDRRVCHHSLQSEERVCVCVCVFRLWLASGRVRLNWIDSVRACVLLRDVCVCVCVCVCVVLS